MTSKESHGADMTFVIFYEHQMPRPGRQVLER